ncbi:uncharacterized protein AMSG_11919 [Thecamonas trahens ATCC 50062]|uniref:Right handed beta helix domain-containing protein n=1 Tax=Thecamonas trahens ATCC 50062 TaxID=461836 RepID=A0A0L0DCU0_THETB|nr:hypothetical protein AMSG_11919 [Thecamonas trahens ATCC 50062]KNC50139.1 hypothetical protein AMSG_11919 [Thecamonas trahens ATCC 50062]|eukprot:XP_013757312.1 hypothetical protein AMSG_11919 [Thecamonas trahens ATCC 50062]
MQFWQKIGTLRDGDCTLLLKGWFNDEEEFVLSLLLHSYAHDGLDAIMRAKKGEEVASLVRDLRALPVTNTVDPAAEIAAREPSNGIFARSITPAALARRARNSLNHLPAPGSNKADPIAVGNVIFPKRYPSADDLRLFNADLSLSRARVLAVAELRAQAADAYGFVLVDPPLQSSELKPVDITATFKNRKFTVDVSAEAGRHVLNGRAYLFRIYLGGDELGVWWLEPSEVKQAVAEIIHALRKDHEVGMEHLHAPFYACTSPHSGSAVSAVAPSVEELNHRLLVMRYTSRSSPRCPRSKVMNNALYNGNSVKVVRCDSIRRGANELLMIMSAGQSLLCEWCTAEESIALFHQIVLKRINEINTAHDVSSPPLKPDPAAFDRNNGRPGVVVVTDDALGACRVAPHIVTRFRVVWATDEPESVGIGWWSSTELKLGLARKSPPSDSASTSATPGHTRKRRRPASNMSAHVGLLVFVLASTLLLASTSTDAATVLVSTTSELTNAINNVAAGDTIQLAAGATFAYSGVTRLTCDADGTAANPITVQGLPGSTMTWTHSSNYVEGFVVTGKHWIFEDLDITGTCSNHNYCEHAFHVQGDADFFVMRRCVIKNFNAQIKSNIGGGQFPDDCLLEHNEFYNTGGRQTSAPVTPANIDGGERWIVRNNYFHDAWKDGGNTISYQTFMKSNGADGIYEGNLIACSVLHSGGVRIGMSFGGGGTSPDSVCGQGTCNPEHRRGIMRDNVIIN